MKGLGLWLRKGWPTSGREPSNGPADGRIGSHPLASLFWASCLGIMLDHLLIPCNPTCWWIFGGFSLVLWWVFHLKEWIKLSCLAIFASVSCAFGGWHSWHWRWIPPNNVIHFASEDPTSVFVQGMVLDSPEYQFAQEQSPLATFPQGATTRLKVSVTNLDYGTENCRKVTGLVSVRVRGHWLGVRPGDRVELGGRLRQIARPKNPGERDPTWLARSERILCQFDVPYPECATIVERGDSASRGEPIFLRLRRAGMDYVDRYISYPASGLAAALLLGARDRLGRPSTEAFFHTGTIHLLSISGLHLGILASVFLFISSRNMIVTRGVVLWVLMIFMGIYCVVTGSQAPVLRATVLILILAAGLLWSRRAPAFNALAGGGLIVLAMQPTDLFRPGAQLSFLAVATLIWLGRHQSPPERTPLQRLIERTRTWSEQGCRWIWSQAKQLTWAGAIIWWITLPLTMHQFHLVSPIALILNTLLAFPVALGLLAGFGAIMLGGWLPELAKWSGGLSGLALSWVERAVTLGESIPGAYFWVAGPSQAWCLIFYGVTATLLNFPIKPICDRGSVFRRRGISILVWSVIWLGGPVVVEGITALRGIEQPFRCTFLSVGHGTCVVMEIPDGRVILYDAGHMGLPETGGRMISEFLWHRHIDRIDTIIISHADADHYNAIPMLLDRFVVDKVYVSPSMFSEPCDPGVLALRDAFLAHRVPWSTLKAGDQWILDRQTRIDILHPSIERVPGSDNANSLVVEVSYHQRRILLPGDLEEGGIDRLISHVPRDCDVLMAPHHGSLHSLPIQFARWCKPEWIIVSGDYDAEAFDPMARELKRQFQAQTLNTSRDGAITVEIPANGPLHVEHFLARD